VAEVFRFALLGLGVGALYSLASQGLMVIYRGSGILNFAHGATGMVGAYVAWEVRDQHGQPFLVALAVGVLASALLGALTHLLVMRQLRRASPLARIVATLGVLILLNGIAVIRYGARVTFEPGARTAWHTHTLGQTLIVTSGVGRVQQWGAPIDEIRTGDVVWIPPGQKHWHGGSPDAAMSHIAVVEQLNGSSTEWLEQVTDAQYRGQLRTSSSAAPAARPAADSAAQTPAQRLIGDFSPKLVDLTDRVLFGEVWARPQLSQRDRSLVTVTALIAMNRPDQLRSHLIRARDNGVTQEEVVEAITHLAFYAGWPSAMTAIGVAKEVFEGR